MTTALSIIIVNYNTFDLTCKCIQSIYRFLNNISYEIILVDNASDERQPELFKELFPSIHLIKSETNLGFAKGNNLGIAQAKGELILLLNSDTEFIDSSPELCFSKMTAQPEIGVISSKLIYPNGETQYVANRFPSIRLELVELLRLHKLVGAETRGSWLLGFYFDHQSEKKADWVWGTFFLTRKSIIDSFEGKKLPEDFFMYFEDVVWCYLIKKKGYQIRYFPQATVVHHLSSSTQAQNNDEKEWQKMLKITSNEAAFLIREKGFFYTWVLFLLRALKYLSLRKKNFVRVANFYFRFVFNRLHIKPKTTQL